VKWEANHPDFSGKVTERTSRAVARIAAGCPFSPLPALAIFARPISVRPIFSVVSAMIFAIALAGPQAVAQTVEPPNTILKAGVVYGYNTPSSTLSIGVGNTAAANFINGGAPTFEVAATNSDGVGLGSSPPTSQLFLYQSNGDGSFSLLPAELATGYGYSNINDGLNLVIAGPVISPSSLDLVVTDDSSNLYLMKGNGDGTFQTPVSLGQVVYTLASYLNSSGTLNLVISYQTFPHSGELSVVDVLANNNDGSGTFTVQTVPTPTSPNVSNAYPLTAGDLAAILLVYVNGTAAISQYSGGSFQAPVSQSLGVPNGIVGPVSTFTSNGNTYFAGISTQSNSSAAYIWPLTMSGSQIGITTPPASYQIPTGDAVFVTAADLDGDGNPDLIVLGGGQFSSTQTINLFLSGPGNSSTPFSPTASQTQPNYIYGPGVYGTEAMIADINGDEKDDLILYEPNQGLTVLLNQGHGLFAAPTTYPAGNRPTAIAKADFNGDGLDDLAVVNGINSLTDKSDNTVSVFISQAPGMYATQAVYPVGDLPFAAATGKVKGNQSLFVLSQQDATGNGSNPVVTFLQGVGNGGFQSPAYFSIVPNLPASAEPSAIAAGNFDSSGNATVAVANVEGTIELFTYQNGVYAPSATTPVLYASGAPAFELDISSLAVADMNGDGNLDLVATLRGQCNYGIDGQTLAGGAVLIFLGNGDGTFQLPVSFTSTETNSDPAFVALGSFVGGTLPDMLVLDGGGGFCISQTPFPMVFSNGTKGGSMQFTETDLTSPIAVESATSELQVSLKAAIADVNGDGFNDIVLSAAGLVSVLPNNGQGGFGSPAVGSPPPDVGSSDSAGLATGSFFGPGGHDVAMASIAGAAIIAANSVSPATPAPVITPPGGTFSSPQTVTITDTLTDASIFYTTDGSIPLPSSTPYAGPITVSASETINAIAIAPGFSQSAVTSAVFTILAPTTTVLTYSPTTIFSGEPVTLTVMVSSNGSPVTGTVTFSENGTEIGTATLDNFGEAHFQIASLPVGLDTLEAAYPGSSSVAPSSASVTVSVAPPPTVTVTPSSAVVGENQTYQFTAVVTGATDTSVTWSVQPGGAGGTINSSGLYTAPPSPGTDTVIATSNADLFVSAQATVTITASGPVIVQVTETITVTDAPTSPDVLDQETVMVTDTPVVVAMPASGIEAAVAYYSVGSVGFGSVSPGQMAAQTFSISNIGMLPLILSGALVSQSPACATYPVPCFSQPQILCTNGETSLPTTLPTAGACLFTVSYTAPSGTAPSGALTITDNAELSNLTSTGSGTTFMQSVPLNGSGSDAPPPVAPPTTLYITDVETITVTDLPAVSDVVDEETVTVTDTPLIVVTPAARRGD
jgi:hypothetical protein